MSIGSDNTGFLPTQRDVSNTIIGAWLFVLYLVTIVISVLMLSSYQIQSRMNYVEIGGVSISVWRLNELSQAYELDKEIQQSLSWRFKDKRVLSENIQARIDQLNATYTPIFDNYYSDIGDFRVAYEAATPGFSFAPPKRHGTSVKNLFDDVKEQIGNFQPGSELEASFKDLEARAAKGDDIFRQIGSAKRNLESKLADIKQQEGEVAKLSKSLKLGVFNLVGGDKRFEGLDKEQLGNLQDKVSEYSQLKNISLSLPYRMATMPSEILVLGLVLAMGVLGSTIFITQLFFRRDKYQNKIDDELNIAFFFSRPWFGAITALSIFVLAKAGVLFLTDPSAKDGTATLSPFFISFIAIISGLFSEQAIMAIKKSADDWFHTQDTFADRWGVGLQAALEKSGRKKESFANASGVPLSVVEDWFSERKLVSHDMQAVLSAWLEVPARDLFTDIAPGPNKKKDKAGKPENEGQSTPDAVGSG